MQLKKCLLAFSLKIVFESIYAFIYVILKSKIVNFENIMCLLRVDIIQSFSILILL